MQQHIGHKGSHHRPEHGEAEQGSLLLSEGQNVSGEHTKAQAGAQGDAHLKDGAHQGNGHHIARRLHMATVIHPQGGRGQRQTHGGVNEDDGGVAGQDGRLMDSGAIRQRVCLIAITGLAQLAKGSQPHHQVAGLTPVAVIELFQQVVHQRGEHHNQKVQNSVKSGQSQQVSGKHGAEHRKGVEKQDGGALHPQPAEQCAQLRAAVHHLHRQRCREDSQMGEQQKGQTGDVVGEKQGIPVKGQRVHHVGAAGGKQIAEHRHSRHQAKDGRERDTRREHLAHFGGQIRQRLRPMPTVGIGGSDIEKPHGQQEHPKQAVSRPNGPEPGHIFGKQGTVKARCHGPHSPHLPIHK